MKKTRSGFTLVELIVVIAILGILAGVGVPVYRGYIAKANEAADLQLLAAVNQSFASACIEKGYYNLKEVYGDITLEEVDAGKGRKITKVGVCLPTMADGEGYDFSPIDIKPLFDKYFVGNEDATFKVYETLEYDIYEGCFKDEAPEGAPRYLRAVVGGKEYTYRYTQAAVEAYNNSNYSHVEISELTRSVDKLAGALSDNKSGLASLANTANFNAALVSLGVVPEGTTFTAAMLNDPALAKEVANASVLYVADTLSGLDPDEVYQAFTNGTVASLTGGSGVDSTFVTAALQYGLLTAFVNTENGAEYKAGFTTDSAAVTGLTSVTNLFNKYTNDLESGTYYDYQEYINSDAAANDIKGFLSALSVINDNSANFDLSSDYSNEDLVEVVNRILHPEQDQD